jgi:hypothetical protein
MVHPIQLVQGAEFKINLETDHIILHGSVDESGGVMLRGSVVLDCHETTKIRSITLKLIGKIKVNWMEGNWGKGERKAATMAHRALVWDRHWLPPTTL